MNKKDIFEGIGQVEYAVQSVHSHEEQMRIPQDNLIERMKYDFSRKFGEAIVASGKLHITERERETNYYTKDIINEARIFLLNERDLRKLISNIEYNIYKEINTFNMKAPTE